MVLTFRGLIGNKVVRAATGCVLIAVALGLSGCPVAIAPNLVISTDTLRFDADDTEKTLTIYNEQVSTNPLFFSINPDVGWIDLDIPATQSLGPFDEVEITVSLNDAYNNLKVPEFATAELLVQSNGGSITVTVTTEPSFFTESFDGGNDLAELGQLTFRPDGSRKYYTLTAPANPDTITELPMSTANAVVLDFAELGDPLEVAPFGNNTIPFYGIEYQRFFVSSRGYIAFPRASETAAESDTKGAEQLQAHFSEPRVSALDVAGRAPGSQVLLNQDSQRVAITYVDVPRANDLSLTSSNDFQIELFFDGRVRITYLNVDAAADGVVGLSGGGYRRNLPPAYVPSDLSEEADQVD